MVEYTKLSQEDGLILKRTIVGKPRQNRVAERVNMTLTERDISMRLHVGLPKTFWADSVS